MVFLTNFIFKSKQQNIERIDFSQRTEIIYMMFSLPKAEIINMQLKSNASNTKKAHDWRKFVRNHWM